MWMSARGTQHVCRYTTRNGEIITEEAGNVYCPKYELHDHEQSITARINVFQRTSYTKNAGDRDILEYSHPTSRWVQVVKIRKILGGDLIKG